jgi:hypothetical protein
MGLDIIAFAHAAVTPEHPEGDSCWEGRHVLAFTLGFPRSIRGLIDGRCYLVDGPKHGFRAGSYSLYNDFRELLCQATIGIPLGDLLMDPIRYVDAPFFELLDFADNEGTIGPVAARALSADFAAGGGTVLPAILIAASDDEDGAEFAGLWENLTIAFDLASNGGLVLFC